MNELEHYKDQLKRGIDIEDITQEVINELLDTIIQLIDTIQVLQK